MKHYKSVEFLSSVRVFSVAAQLRFCPLLHIDWFKTRNNTLSDLFDLSTVCVHNKQLHFKADRGPFVVMRFSEQNEQRNKMNV